MDNEPGSIFSFKSLSWHLGRQTQEEKTQAEVETELPTRESCLHRSHFVKGEDPTGTPRPQILKQNRKNVV